MSEAFSVSKNVTVQIQPLVGVALYPDDTANPSRLPEMAEAAMLNSQDHQQPLSYFDQKQHETLRSKLDIEQGLKRAIVKDLLSVYLQPKYKFKDDDVYSYEALIRWHDPDLGQVSPAEFIPIAEQTTLGQTLDRYVIDKIFRFIKDDNECADNDDSGRRRIGQIAINITAKHFNDPSLSEFIKGKISDYGVSPTQICLEVTEGVLLAEGGHVIENLNYLRDLGVEVSIDDFGTGYSSLAYLRSLPADELKIDKSFIDDLETTTGKTLVNAIINVAKAFGLRVVAEGIETERQMRTLIEMGCDYGQGYLLARPAPASEVLCKD